jgi:hypothetical protein
MRKAQYERAPVEGDTEPSSVNVYYFGPESGGGVEANIQRWIGQITLPEGSEPAQAVQRSTFTVNGMPAHFVAVNGGYDSSMGRPMGGGGGAKAGYRLVGVVLAGPEGNVFFKLTGPESTARAMETDLMTMIRSAHQAN